MTRVAIVGGGIGGLATAIALRRVGFEVHVYERANELTEVGSALSLWPNALRSLQSIDSDVFRSVRGNGDQLRRFLMREACGKPIKTVRLPKTDLDGVAILRSDLLSALAPSEVAAGPGEWKFGFTDGYQADKTKMDACHWLAIRAVKFDSEPTSRLL